MLWTIFKVSTKFATILPLVFFFFFFWLPDMWSPSSLTRDWTCIALHWKLKLQPWTTRQVPWAFQKTTDRASRTWRVVRCSRWPLSPTISWGFPLQWDLGLIFRLYPPPPSTRFLPEFILSLFFSFQFSSQLFISFSKLSSNEENYLVFEDCFWMCRQLSDKETTVSCFPIAVFTERVLRYFYCRLGVRIKWAG